MSHPDKIWNAVKDGVCKAADLISSHVLNAVTYVIDKVMSWAVAAELTSK